MSPPVLTIEQIETRFWSKVDTSGDCWRWTGAKCSTGYGAFEGGERHPAARTRLTHRIAYALTQGGLPEGLTLDHLCRVRDCVNPAHLEPVTRGENVLRGVGHAAQNKRKTHCVRGHKLPPPGENGWRHCHPCVQQRVFERSQREKAERAARGLLGSGGFGRRVHFDCGASEYVRYQTEWQLPERKAAIDEAIDRHESRCEACRQRRRYGKSAA